MSTKITREHLERGALVYVRQSTPGQVEDHPESRRRQYALVTRARELGFQSVDVIDEDLGRSGSGFTERPGFQRLLSAVCSGQVGAVLALEASRLARNDLDWSRLVEFGALCSVLLVDYDGVYDPRLLNDRLLLGLKGIMSEFELATLRQRAYEAVRGKAARGELRLALPVGFVRGCAGAIELDPDARVQHAIRLLFGKFDELGSIRQVMLWFRRQGLKLPVLRQVKDQGAETFWDKPTYYRVRALITNPIYAGAYAFGRTEHRTIIDDGRIKRTKGHRRPMDQWEVLIRDHHPGYIDWQRFLCNRALVEENTFMKPSTGRKSARGGRSLLSGLLQCRRCGHTLEVSYRGSDNATAAFRCSRGHHVNGAERCISFSGRRVEKAVATQILQAVEAKAIDAAIEAAKRGDERRRAQRETIALELEQARYQAQLAARRYERVDPDQRLVAAELEARWNVALQSVASLEARLKKFDALKEHSQRVDEQRLRALAADLPALWNAETTDMRIKQRIVRLLIRHIVADVDDEANQIVLVIHWQGGRHTDVRVDKPSIGRNERRTEAEVIEILQQMAGRWQDKAIATTLNRIGARTATGKRWTRERVRSLRHRLELPSFDPENRDGTILTCVEAAQRLGISGQYLGDLLSRGLIPGRQVAPGAPWQIRADVLDSAQVRETLRGLSRRRRRKSDSSPNTPMIPGL